MQGLHPKRKISEPYLRYPLVNLRFLFFLLILFPFCTELSAQNWTELSPVPVDGRDDATAFSINGKAYLVTGNMGSFSESNRLWMYTPETNSWTEKAVFPGEARQYATSFSVGTSAYVIAGISASGTPLKDVWKYESLSDSWIQLADFPGTARWSMFSFELFGKGYLGTGTSGTELLKDCWSYDPEQDAWEQLPDFPGEARRESVGFSSLGKGYAGLGYVNLNGTGLKADMYRFNYILGTWTRLEDYPAGERAYAIGIGTAAGAYVGSGINEAGVYSSAFYSLDPVTDTWSTLSQLPVLNGIKGMSAFAIGSSPFFLTGITGGIQRVSNMWKWEGSADAPDTFVVYPNPGSGTHILQGAAGTHFTIWSTESKQIMEGEIDAGNTTLIEGLESGLYFVQFLSEANKTTETKLLLVE